MRTIFAFVALILTCLVGCQSAQRGDLEGEFRNPGTEYRALALWPWLNGYVDTARLVYELDQMKEKGMRGALIWDIGTLMDRDSIIPVGPAMLGPESLSFFKLAMDHGADLGLDIGWFASSSWNAGGPWVEEENASLELRSVSQVVEGPAKLEIPVGEPVMKRNRVTRAVHFSSVAIPHRESKELDYAHDEIVTLDAFTDDDGVIHWEAPAGQWEVISFFMSNTMQPLVCPSPNSNGLIIDHLSEIATRNYFDSVLTRLSAIQTPGNRLKFFMLDSYEVWPMTDWTPRFVEEFQSRYAYDPQPYLPLLDGWLSRDTVLAERFRGDYARLVSDLMIENHFGQSVDIADEHGFEMMTEAGHGGYPRVDPLKALGHSHIPMGEFWNRQRFWVNKEAASAAHLYGKKLVASESLTGWNHWQHGPTDFKQLIDIAFCEGMNQLVFHTFSHNPEIAGKPGFVYHAGEHVNVNATWWDMSRPFMDYLARCSYLLRQGLFVGDACLYYGDQAPNLVPPKRIDPNITPIFGDDQCLHCGLPKPVNPGRLYGYDYDYMNADIIVSQLDVKDGRWVLPTGQSYRVMQIPDREDINLEVLKSLEVLVNKGGILIGQKPQRATSLKNYPGCDEEVSTLADRMWGDCDGVRIFSSDYGAGRIYWGKTLGEVLTELKIPPDMEVTGTDNSNYHIDYIHRQTDSEDIYFVSNSWQLTERVTCVFRVDGKRVPEIWDAETGLIQREVSYRQVEQGIAIDLVLEPIASRFIVFRDRSSRKNDPELVRDLQYGTDQIRPLYSMDLSTGWQVAFDPDWGGPSSARFDSLTSWSEALQEGVRYYSGTAVYRKEVELPADLPADSRHAFLRLENIQEMARVRVNGTDCGIVWVPPYRIEISEALQPGNNLIELEVVNTWNNRIVGDLQDSDRPAFTKTNAKSRFRAGGPLLPSGILGRAELIWTE